MTTLNDPIVRLILVAFCVLVVWMELTLVPEVFGIKIREELPRDPLSANIILSLVPAIPLLLWRSSWLAKRALSQKEKAEKEATYLAFHDPLTGLGNRRMFACTLERILGGASRPAVAILLIDLDGFKTVNDNHGHDAGDAVLVTIADRLGRLTDDCATCIRMGGDEFAIVLTPPDSIDTHDAAKALAAKICSVVKKPVPIDGADAPIAQVSASIGIAVHLAVTDPDSLLRDADRAMYAAKSNGKDNWQCAA